MRDLTYIEDLARELSEEHLLTYDEALEICKLNVEFVYELVQDPNIVTINFPLLGNMHFNYKRGKYAGKFRKYKDILSSQLDRVGDMMSKHKDQVHGRNSYMAILKTYFYPNKEDRRLARRRELFRKIEEKQNQ